MPRKRTVPESTDYMVAMTKADDGYLVTIGTTNFSLPTDSEIYEQAIVILSEYDSHESMAVQIFKRCSIELELVNEEGVFENRIGVVLHASKKDAEILSGNFEMYGDIVSAIGEVCNSIEDDRIQVAE